MVVLLLLLEGRGAIMQVITGQRYVVWAKPPGARTKFAMMSEPFDSERDANNACLDLIKQHRNCSWIVCPVGVNPNNSGGIRDANRAARMSHSGHISPTPHIALVGGKDQPVC